MDATSFQGPVAGCSCHGDAFLRSSGLRNHETWSGRPRAGDSGRPIEACTVLLTSQILHLRQLAGWGASYAEVACNVRLTSASASSCGRCENGRTTTITGIKKPCSAAVACQICCQCCKMSSPCSHVVGLSGSQEEVGCNSSWSLL